LSPRSNIETTSGDGNFLPTQKKAKVARKAHLRPAKISSSDLRSF